MSTDNDVAVVKKAALAMADSAQTILCSSEIADDKDFFAKLFTAETIMIRKSVKLAAEVLNNSEEDLLKTFAERLQKPKR